MEMKLSDVARAFERAKIDGRKLIALTPQTVGQKLRINDETQQMRVCAALAPLKQRAGAVADASAFDARPRRGVGRRGADVALDVNDPTDDDFSGDVSSDGWAPRGGRATAGKWKPVGSPPSSSFDAPLPGPPSRPMMDPTTPYYAYPAGQTPGRTGGRTGGAAHQRLAGELRLRLGGVRNLPQGAGAAYVVVYLGGRRVQSTVLPPTPSENPADWEELSLPVDQHAALNGAVALEAVAWMPRAGERTLVFPSVRSLTCVSLAISRACSL